MPHMMKAGSEQAGASGFSSELRQAIQSWGHDGAARPGRQPKGARSNGSNDDARRPAAVKPDRHAPFSIGAVAATAPAAPTAAFGLPTAGPDPGADGGGMQNQVGSTVSADLATAAACGGQAAENPPS